MIKTSPARPFQYCKIFVLIGLAIAPVACSDAGDPLAPAAGGSQAASGQAGNSVAPEGGKSGSQGGTVNAGGTTAAGAPSGGSAGASGTAGGQLTTGGNTAAGGKSGGTSGAAPFGGTNSSGGTSATSGGVGGATSGGATGSLGVCGPDDANARFVDSVAGDDAKDGRSMANAWKTTARVNAETFQAGQRICFKAGGVWTGSLVLKGSGSAAAPIIIDQYGSGALPRIAAAKGELQALLLANQSYWEINHLELTNNQGGPGDYRGIAVRGKDVGVLKHIVVNSCFVHDVTGEVKWISGSTADDQPPWVKFKAGWDASKRTGGIVFEVDSANNTPTWFEEVIVENNRIENTSFAGIIFKQFAGSVGWGVRDSASDTKFKPHKNITIRGNYVSQSGTQYGCNGLYVTGSQSVHIDHNVVSKAGTSAIEIYNSDDVVVEHNEAFGTTRKAGGADSNGIDADRATTKTIIQYNYVHDNGDGILLCEFVFGDSVARYNLIVNNSRYGINLHSDSAAKNSSYNNLLFYDATGGATLLGSSGGSDYFKATYAFRNNIFYTTRGSDSVPAGSGLSYDSNLYRGVAAASGDSHARSADPQFVNAASKPNGDMNGPALDRLAGFQLKSGSPALNAGQTISNNGGADFWGTPLYAGSPDIGPFEAPQ